MNSPKEPWKPFALVCKEKATQIAFAVRYLSKPESVSWLIIKGVSVIFVEKEIREWHACTWSLTLSDALKWRVFENRVLR